MSPLFLAALALSSVLCLVGCTQGVPAPEAVPRAPEDLSHWRVPTLVQPLPLPAPLPTAPAPPKPTAEEKVFDYTPGRSYKVQVAIGFPLDIILERGEIRRNIAGADPTPVPQGEEKKLLWDVKEGKAGQDGTLQERIFLQATEAGRSMGVIITTTRRVYYLTCESVKSSPIRAVRWRYGDVVPAPPAEKPPSLLPHPDQPRQYHVGYTVTTSTPPPAFIPRHIVDDGEKLYLVYAEITLFKRVPLVRAIEAQGPQVINSRQFLNVVIIDSLPTRLELRIGPDQKDQYAETVTITQGTLRTIDCPGDPDCPIWPAAAQHLAGR